MWFAMRGGGREFVLMKDTERVVRKSSGVVRNERKVSVVLRKGYLKGRFGMGFKSNG